MDNGENKEQMGWSGAEQSNERRNKCQGLCS